MTRSILIPLIAVAATILLVVGAVMSQQSPRQAVKILFNDGSAQEIASAADPAPRAKRAGPPQSRIGMNLDGPFTYSPTDAFIDAMKTANRFGSFDRPEDKKAPADELGWPTVGQSGVVIFVQRDPADVQGTYKLIIEGKTIPSLINSGKSTISELFYDPATNRTTGKVNVVGGSLWLRFSGEPGIRVRLLRPGYDSDEQIFTEAFLKMLRPDPATGTFGGVRFMDWNGTNNSAVTTWDSRRKIDSATWSGEVPLEVQVELCNRLKTDGWFCIPHQVDDDYILRFKELIDQRLDPQVDAIVEYSNEVWNWIFRQAKWNLEEAKRRSAMGDDKLTMGGTQTNEGYWAQFIYAEQTVRLKKLLGPRFKVVLAGHYGYGKVTKDYGYWTKKHLEYIHKHYGDPARYIDAIAIAPYYSVGSLATTRPVGAEEYLQALERAAGTTASPRFDAWVAVARSINRPLWAYEAGTHDVKPKTVDGAPAGVLLAQRDPRMGKTAEVYLTNFFEHGGDRLFWFVACARNTNEYTWGATWSLRALDAPKYEAIEKVATTRPIE